MSNQSVNRKSIIAIALVLLMTFSILCIALPTTMAHTPPISVPTYAYINLGPNPVGVGQQVTVLYWLDKVPVGAEGPYGDRWNDLTVTVTKPDGTNQTLGPYSSDANGGGSTTYIPTSVGTYKFVFNFPGQVAKDVNPYPSSLSLGLISLELDYVNDTFLPSSANTTLTVQAQPIASAPVTPLPTSYWARPINAMNNNWYSIAGNWLGLGANNFGDTGTYDQNGNFDPYSTAPTTAHIMWTQPIAFGGILGGAFGSSDTAVYATGTAYETKFGGIIINGDLYYTDYPGAKNDPANLTAVNLETGQTLWTENTGESSLRCGMVYDFVTGDQYGAHAYLFTAPSTYNGWVLSTAPNEWQMYDAMTGAWILNIANPTAGTLVDGPNGEILSYTLANGMLTMWNASLCIAVGSQKDNLYLIYGAGEIWRPPQGATIAWSGGNQWSVPIASNITGVPITEPETLTGVDNGVALVTAQGGFVAGGQGLSVGGIGYRIDAGYNATTGQLLWGPVNRTLTPYTTNSVVLGDGKYFQYTTETETWSCYSLTTGQLLWGPTTPETSPLDYDDYSAPSVVGYGNLYAWGYGGSIYCYNDTTGAIEWTWSAGNAGYNTPYGVYPLGTFGGNDILADGMLYVSSGHDYTPPLFKGAEIYCINATTGKEIWDEPNFNAGGPALADGYMVWDNAYDNQLYAYGTGPSKTTVTAPDPVTSVGSAMVIRGTVTDISPGSQQNAVAMNFPNGLPCVSDASMSQFMAAAYQQQPMPTNVTGVPVTVSVIDSNGNTRVIGKTTSDASGMFTLTWMPNIPGNYTVIANFAGSGGYYGSYAETSFYATAAPATQAPTNAPATGLATMSGLTYGIAIAVIAIIIAIAIVGLLIIRKKP